MRESLFSCTIPLFKGGEAPGGSGATTGYHCFNNGGPARRLRDGGGRAVASNRALVRTEVLYTFSASDLPRMVLLPARLPYALQSIPMLVCHHVKGSFSVRSAVRQPAATVAWSDSSEGARV